MNDGLSFLLRFPLRTRARETPRKVMFGRMVVDEDVIEGQHENGVCHALLSSVHIARSGESTLGMGSHTSEKNERRTKPVPLFMACETPCALSTHISRTFLITLPWKLGSDERLEGGIEGSDSRTDRSTRFARERVERASSAFNIH